MKLLRSKLRPETIITLLTYSVYLIQIAASISVQETTTQAPTILVPIPHESTTTLAQAFNNRITQELSVSSSLNCPSSDDWQFEVNGERGRSCGWVSINPYERCLTSTGAKEACGNSCCDINESSNAPTIPERSPAHTPKSSVTRSLVRPPSENWKFKVNEERGQGYGIRLPSASTIKPDNCVDSPMRFKVRQNSKMIVRSCEWVARINTVERCTLSGVNETCPLTCGSCGKCTDSKLRIKFVKKGETKTRSCEWTARFNTVERCAIDGMPKTCRATCGYCDPPPAAAKPWRFLVIPDIHGMGSFAWDNLIENKKSSKYIDQQIVIKHIKKTYGGELIMIPGDASSFGSIRIKDIMDKLGGDISDQEAVYEAGRNYSNATRELFKGAGYDMVITAVGDHELGGNEGFRTTGPKSKITTVPHARRAFGDGFNRNNGKEFIFNQMLFGMPSRPLNTPFENTTFAYLHKNSLFITVDAFEIVGDGSKSYIDRENGYGGEGAVICTVSGDHLLWLENILRWGKTNTNVRHIFVQAHLPIIQPVRKVNCSGQFLDAGEESDFWHLMEDYDVDIYFAGEVHANTATKTKQSSSNLIQIVSRGNGYNNFLTVNVTKNVIDVKLHNEFGEKQRLNAQYKEAGRITIDKTNLVPNISSSGMLELLELNSSIITFTFEEIKPMGMRQVLGMKGEDNLIPINIFIRDINCTESFSNVGTFGAQYDAQIGNVALVEGRYGYSASFNEESRMAIYGVGPFGAGEVISFGLWFKTSQLSRKMVLLHYGNYWNGNASRREKDYFSLLLDNGMPVIYTNKWTSVRTIGLQNLADGQWRHIAISMPHKSCLVSDLEIFVDGETINTITIGDRHLFYTTSGKLSIGGYGYSGSDFEDEYPDVEPYIGRIDDFLLFTRPIDKYSDFFKHPS